MAFMLIALCLAAAPVTALLLMILMGFVTVWAGVLAIVLTGLSCAGFCCLWARDLDRLTTAVHRIESGDAAGESVGPILMAPLGLELARLSRSLAARGEAVKRERRADTLILESLPDPLIVLREDGAVSRRNPATETVLGADLAAVLRHPALRETLDRARRTGETARVPLSLAGPVERELLAIVAPVNPPLADGGHAVVVVSDRTREHSAERSRTDFVANVSHELRTPLASLIGFTETLLGPARNDPEARQRFLTIMAEQGARMNRLIDDLLSLSRIEMVEHQAPFDPIGLAALLTRIVAGYEPRLRESGARLSVDVAPDLPDIVGDADQIAQVVHNLLDNGVKYGTPGGTVTLGVRLSAGGASWPIRPGVVLSVSDEGAGIPRAHLPRLTERFYRVDKSRSRAAGGTGLGLAIVKHIVNRHRGQLLIESEEGKGTAVSVWLPVGRAAV